MNNKETKENLIKEIGVLSNELGRTPKKREFKNNTSAIHHFGTWNNFLIESNLIPLKQLDLTLKDYEDYIHQFVKNNKRTPTKEDFDKNIYLPDTRTMERKFKKSWSEILIKLGYKPNIRTNDFSDFTNKELLNIVESELNRIGSTKIIDYRDKRVDHAPSEKFLLNKLGIRWNEMLHLLGLETNIEQRSKEEWLDLLRKIAKKMGKTPSIGDLSLYGLNEGVYKYNFGSYNNAIKEAGLNPNKAPIDVNTTDEELLNMYVNFSKKIGKGLEGATSKDLDESEDIYNSDVFMIRFGGMGGLREQAGFQFKMQNKKYSKKIIKNILLDQYKKENRRLTNSELNLLSQQDEEFPSVTTICRYFKTTKMSEVWEEIIKD